MSNKVLETVEYKGHVINVHHDEYGDSPDTWKDESLFLVYDHRDFTIEREGFVPLTIFEESWNQGKSTYDGYWVFGVDAYIHSGVSLALKGSVKAARFTDRRWDVSFKGFVLVKRQKGTWTSDKAKKLAEALIKSWNECLSGEIYGYTIDGDCDDSCWGYHGDEGKEDLIITAKNNIDFYLEKQLEEAS